jgi:hypothetical protein
LSTYNITIASRRRGQFTLSYAETSADDDEPEEQQQQQPPPPAHVDPQPQPQQNAPAPKATVKKEAGTDALPHMVKETKAGQTDVSGETVGREYIHIDDFNKAREQMVNDFRQLDADYRRQVQELGNKVSKTEKQLRDVRTVLDNFDMTGDINAHATALQEVKTALGDEYQSLPSSANTSARATPAPEGIPVARVYESQIQNKLDIIKNVNATRDEQERALNELKAPIQSIKKGKSTTPPVIGKSRIVTEVKPLQISKTSLTYRRPEVSMKAFSLQDIFSQTHKKKVVW